MKIVELLKVNSVLLRQNPHNVHEWMKRAELYKEKPRQCINTFTEALQEGFISQKNFRRKIGFFFAQKIIPLDRRSDESCWKIAQTLDGVFKIL